MVQIKVWFKVKTLANSLKGKKGKENESKEKEESEKEDVIDVDDDEYDENEGNVLFNDTLNAFYLRLYGVRRMVKDHSGSER